MFAKIAESGRPAVVSSAAFVEGLFPSALQCAHKSIDTG